MTQQLSLAEDSPAPRKLAPEGVYYLRNPIRIETDAGITGYKRGTKLFKASDGLLKTGAGEPVKTDEVNLTNDLEEIQGNRGRRIGDGVFPEAHARNSGTSRTGAAGGIRRDALTPRHPGECFDDAQC
jgi:hypothetical protein